MTTIAVLGGTGAFGSGLSYQLVKNGYKVLIGTRSIEKAQEKIDELRTKVETANIEAVTYQDACRADIIYNTVPYTESIPLFNDLKELLSKKIIVDCSVPLNFGKIITTLHDDNISQYYKIKLALSESTVVMALKTFAAGKLQKSKDIIQNTDFIATDTEDIYNCISEIHQKFISDTVWIKEDYHIMTIERMTALSVQLNKQYKTITGFQLTGIKSKE
jgi:8-hydroxy-5-deazaflavin:NADPH oxidoreductase